MEGLKFSRTQAGYYPCDYTSKKKIKLLKKQSVRMNVCQKM